MMTKQDFAALAAAIAGQREDIAKARTVDDRQTTLINNLTCDLIAGAIADVCQRSNPRFDRGRFYAACGYDKVRS
jgi:hypothetical protein